MDCYSVTPPPTGRSMLVTCRANDEDCKERAASRLRRLIGTCSVLVDPNLDGEVGGIYLNRVKATSVLQIVRRDYDNRVLGEDKFYD